MSVLGRINNPPQACAVRVLTLLIRSAAEGRAWATMSTERRSLTHVRLVGLPALPCGRCFPTDSDVWIGAFYSQGTPPEADVPELLRSILVELQDIRDRLGRLEPR